MEKSFLVQGVYSAMMTPFSEKGMISEEGLEAFMNFYIEKQIDGIFAVSNVGEFASLTLEQKKFLIKKCTQLGKGKLKVCPGVMELNLDSAIELAEYAAECNADAVVLSSPFYYPYSKEYLIEYLHIFVKSSPLPVIIYNSPKFANPISLEELMKIISHPNVIALKESSGDVKFLIKLMDRIKTSNIDISVMLGWEELLLTGLIHGTSGCITSCGGVVPEILQKIIESFKMGDLKNAVRYQESISKITEILSSYGFPQGYKLGMAARGLDFKILQSTRMSKLEERLQMEIPKVKHVIDEQLDKFSK